MKRQLLPLLLAAFWGSTPLAVFSQSVFSGSILDDAMIKSLRLSESQVTKIVDCDNEFQKKADDLQKEESMSSAQKKEMLETLTNGRQEYIEMILTEEAETNNNVEFAAGIKVPKCPHIYQPKVFKMPRQKLRDYEKEAKKKYMTLSNNSTGYRIPLNPNQLPNFDIRNEFSADLFFKRLEKKYTTWTHCYSDSYDVSNKSTPTESFEFR